MPARRTLILGDIHGRYDMLQGLLRVCNYREEHDEIIVLGDVIDRPGVQSRQVLEFLADLRARGRSPVVIMGNHEYVIQAIGEGHLPAIEEWVGTYGGDKTLKSYNVDPARIRRTGAWVFFDGKPMNGRQFLLRIFPPDHLALIDGAITTLLIKNVCTGTDLLCSHAGPTSDKSFAEMEPWLWCMGDEHWYKSNRADKFPRNIIHVFGHFHAERPMLQPGRIGLGLSFELAAYSVEEQTVYVSDGEVIQVRSEWVCPR
jgi:hypothetical protein